MSEREDVQLSTATAYIPIEPEKREAGPKIDSIDGLPRIAYVLDGSPDTDARIRKDLCSIV